jgi:hypothetical protein
MNILNKKIKKLKIKKGGYSINIINNIQEIEQIEPLKEVIIKHNSKIYISIGGKINKNSNIPHDYTINQIIPGFIFDIFDDSEIVILLIDNFNKGNTLNEAELQLNIEYINKVLKYNTGILREYKKNKNINFNINIIICNMYYTEAIHTYLYNLFLLKYPLNNIKGIQGTNIFLPSNKNWIMCSYVLFYNMIEGSQNQETCNELDRIFKLFKANKEFNKCIYQWAGLKNKNLIVLYNSKFMYDFNMGLIPPYSNGEQSFTNGNIQSFFFDENNNNKNIKALKKICGYTIDIFPYYNHKDSSEFPFSKTLSQFI